MANPTTPTGSTTSDDVLEALARYLHNRFQHDAIGVAAPPFETCRYYPCNIWHAYAGTGS